MIKKLFIIILAGIILLPNVSFAAKAFDVNTAGTLETSLQSFYNLEDVNDEFSTNNLTNVASVAFNAGKINNAGDVGASNTTKLLYNTNDMGIQGGVGSISFWVNVTTAPATNVYNFFTSVSDAGTKSMLGVAYHDVSGTKKLYFIREKVGTVNEGVDITTTLTTGTWYHMVITYDATNIEGWINGVSQGTSAASGNGSYAGTIDNSAIFSYGSTGTTPNQTSSGLIDLVGVWSKKLSNTEIADLYNSGTGNAYREQVSAIVNLMQIFWFW